MADLRLLSRENLDLQSSISLLTNKNEELQNSLKLIQNQLYESKLNETKLENSAAALKTESNLFQNEAKLHKQQMLNLERIYDSLQKEYEDQTKSNLMKITELNSLILDLKNEIACTSSKHHYSLESLEKYRENYEKILFENSQLQDNYHESLQREIFLEQRLHSENESLNQLVTFYRESTDKSSKRVALLEEENTELKVENQRLLKEIESSELELNEEISHYKAELRILKEENEKLHSLPIPGNSDIDAQYMDTSSLQLELFKTKRDNRDLQHSFKELVANVKKRMPLIEEQKCQYDLVVEENKRLNEKLIKLETEHDDFVIKYKESHSQEERVKLINISLEKNIKTLSSQVQVLLTQNEFLKNNATINEDTSSQILVDYEAIALNSKGVIDTILTPFQDIKELQQQNQNLLYVTQELSDRLEAEEIRLKNKINDLETALSGDYKPLFEELSNQIKLQSAKILALNSEIEVCHRVLKKNSTNACAPNLDDNSPQNTSVTDLQMIKAKLENELRQSNKSCSEKITEFANKLKEAMASLNAKEVEITKLKCTLASTEEQLKLNKTLCEIHKEELEDTLHKCSSLEKEITSVNQIQNKCLLENEALKTLNEQTSLRLQVFTGERDSLNDFIVQLRQEISRSTHDEAKAKLSMKDKEIRLNQLLKTTSSRENNVLIMELQEEKRLLKEKIQDLIDDQATVIARHDRISITFNNKFIQLNQRVLEIQKDRDNLQIELSQSQKRIKELEKENKGLTSKIDFYPTPLNSENDFADLINKLNDAENKIAELTKKLVDKTREHASNKNALENLSEVYMQFKSDSEAQQKAHSKEVKDLINDRQKVESEIEIHKTRISDLVSELNSHQDLIVKNESEYNSELQKLKLRLLESQTSNEALAKEIELLKTDLDSANNNYEQELTSHADKISILNQYRSELLSLKSEIHSLKQQLDISKAKEAQALKDVNKLKSLHGQKIAEMSIKLSDMENLKNGFFSQLQTEKYIDFNSTDLSEVLKNNEVSSELLEFLKTVKEDSKFNIDQLSDENKNLHTEIATLTASLDQAQKTIELEKSKCQKLHSEIIADKETNINLLRESNCFLRTERDELESSRNTLQSELSFALEKLAPLQDEIKTLSSELELYKNETKLLKEANTEWMERVQSVLIQSEKIDPEEFSKVEKEALVLREKLAQVQANLASLQSSHEKEANDLKNTIKELNGKNTKLRQTGLHFKRLYEDSKAENNRNTLPKEQHAAFSKLQSDFQNLKSQFDDISRINSILEVKSQKLASIRAALGINDSDEGEESVIQKLIQCKDKVETLEKNNANMSEKLTKYIKGYTVCKKALNDSKEELEKLKLSIIDLESQIQIKSEELKKCETRIKSMEADSTNNSESLNQLAIKHQQELDNLKEENQNIIKSLNDTHSSQVAQMEMRFKAQISKPAKEIERLKNEISSLKEAGVQEIDMTKSPVLTNDPKVAYHNDESSPSSMGIKREYDASVENINDENKALKKSKNTELDNIIAEDLNTVGMFDITSGGIEEPDDLLLSNDEQLD